MPQFKKIVGYIGFALFALIILGAFLVVMRYVYWSPWVSLFILLSCPFIAYYFVLEKKSYTDETFQYILAAILLLSGFCCYTVLAGRGKHEAKLESLLLKGKMMHSKVYVEDQETDSGEYIPAHYETQYYFELAKDQPEIFLSLISWSFVIFTFGMPLLVYFIVASSGNKILVRRKP